MLLSVMGSWLYKEYLEQRRCDIATTIAFSVGTTPRKLLAAPERFLYPVEAIYNYTFRRQKLL